jgi:hypothetical protein
MQLIQKQSGRMAKDVSTVFLTQNKLGCVWHAKLKPAPIRFHPICAYLRGCVFEISRSEEL